jgi:hypothetical protein
MDFQNKSIEQIEEALCYGQCYPAAIAMSEILSWPIGGLLAETKASGWMPQIAHAYLIAPDGRAMDAGGFRTLEDIHANFITPEREKQCRNIRFVEFGNADEFRRAMRPLYLGVSFDESHRFYDPDFDPELRTDYDDFLDENLPGIRVAVTERLDVESRARAEFGSDWMAAA